jgi:peptide/nickel transport system permease protein
MVSILALAGIFAPWITPNDPLEQHLVKRLEGPSLEFPLGTDSLGRCVASRLIYGIRPSIGISLTVSLLVAMFGLMVGMLSAYYRTLDNVMMRVTDCFFAFPSLVMSLVVIAIIGPGINSLILALAIPGWPKYARVVRGIALSIKERAFVEATRAIGANDGHILRRCILPGVWAPVMTIATIGMGAKVISIAALGFLGLGVQPPAPEWGTIMSKGLPLLGFAPHISISAGVAIMLAVLAFTLIGEGLRDSIDPKANDRGMQSILVYR